MRVDLIGMQSGDFFLKNAHIANKTHIEKELILMGYRHLTSGFSIGILERNNIDGTFHGNYQILELHDTGSERDKDKITAKIARENK
jgi:hypothetical protein